MFHKNVYSLPKQLPLDFDSFLSSAHWKINNFFFLITVKLPYATDVVDGVWKPLEN